MGEAKILGIAYTLLKILKTLFIFVIILYECGEMELWYIIYTQHRNRFTFIKFPAHIEAMSKEVIKVNQSKALCLKILPMFKMNNANTFTTPAITIVIWFNETTQFLLKKTNMIQDEIKLLVS